MGDGILQRYRSTSGQRCDQKVLDVGAFLGRGTLHCGEELRGGHLVGFFYAQVSYYFWVDKGICGLIIYDGKSFNGTS